MEIGNILTLVGICVTGLFSFLTWRATRNNYKLSQSIALSQQKQEDALREEYCKTRSK